MIKVEIVYVDEKGLVFQQALMLNQGATLAKAIEESKFFQDHPETQTMSFGIYGKEMPLESLLQDGDRVEIYRPLALDPKEKRRKLAKKPKTR